MSHTSKPLPAPGPAFSFQEESQFRRTVETNFQDVYAHIEAITSMRDREMAGEVLKYQLLFLGGPSPRGFGV